MLSITPGRETRRLSITADWVVPVSSPPVQKGVVIVENGRIAGVLAREDFDSRLPGKSLTDYGQAIITPGLINLHTHLDYTLLRLFDPAAGLFRWIPGLARRASAWSAEQWLRSAASGAEEVALSGTTCVADSSYSGAAARALARAGLRAVVGLELFGIDEAEAGNRWANWLSRRQSFTESDDSELAEALQSGRIRLSVSPHAPYTVCPALWRKAYDWANDAGLPVLTHICESSQEVSWVKGNEPEIDHFLQTMIPGAIPDSSTMNWRGNGRSPVELLSDNELLGPATIAAHAVHVTPRDIELLARSGCSAVHCPRSNARLKAGAAPLEKLLSAGVKVGFGTDSAASTDDLDVLSEARFGWALARALTPSFSRDPAEAFEMLTLRAARILGLDEEIGSLEPGKRADIAIFSTRSRAPEAAGRPLDLLLYGEARLSDLFVDGREIVSDGVLTRKELLPCSAREIPLF